MNLLTNKKKGGKLNRNSFILLQWISSSLFCDRDDEVRNKRVKGGDHHRFFSPFW
jgi:hypothetical protein